MDESKPVLPPPISRHDTSACEHLLPLIASATNQAGDDSTGLSSSAIGKRYGEVVKWGAVAEGAKRRKVAPAQCQTCTSTLARPWACLTCSYTGCMSLHASSSKAAHKTCLRDHWGSNEACMFGVDPSCGALFCHACDDMVYSDTFEELLHSIRIRVEEDNDTGRDQSSIAGGKGRSRGHWKAWAPTEGHKALIGDMTRTSCRGIRPLLNLSQTCFLSAILQALIHNPLLKAYFLSDKHNRHICYNNSKGLVTGRPYLGAEHDERGGGAGPDREKGCMCCEMDRAFEEFHNDDKSPYGPITMLYAMWHASAELEGYGQQDAHSFFLAALDQIHAHAKGQMSSCNCIAHSTFAGSLTSTVTCSACHEPSITVDPILDIQLDFPTSASNSGMLVNGHGDSSSGSTPGIDDPITLASLLRRFCAEEKVVGDPGKGYACSKCGGGPGVGATRRLMIKKLPPVLSFQLKRFAHNSTSTKIESPIRFPSTLDMRPYTEQASDAASSPSAAHHHAETDGERENNHDTPSLNGNSNSPSTLLPPSLYIYDLFAVVTHEGKLDNGHYWADVLSVGSGSSGSAGGGGSGSVGGEWWHCDDDKVTPTTLGAVLAQKAYMLFYVKRSLAYVQPRMKAGLGSSGGGGVGNGTGNEEKGGAGGGGAGAGAGAGVMNGD